MCELIARAGMTIRASTGIEALGVPDRMSTPFFYKAYTGDVLKLLDGNYLFNVATYSPRIDEKYIYTYAYQPDESWTEYNHDLSGGSYRGEDYVFTDSCYFRVCLKRGDGADFTCEDEQNINSILQFVSSINKTATDINPFIIEESNQVISKIAETKKSDSLVFALISDTHIAVNGIWRDTLASLKVVGERAGFDGIIHLGDITDGMVTSGVTQRYVSSALNDLRDIGVPLYVAIGNHDTNYFAGNTEPFSIEEQCELYLSHSDNYTVRERGKPWYYTDFREQELRLIFLHSFDYTEKYRYGFSDSCIDWVEKTLYDMPQGYKSIIFSHLTPLVKLQAWTDMIRGGDRLAALLDAFNTQSEGRLLAYINGHNHSDQVYRGLSFPIVSIGCAKIEYFEEHKPEGSCTPQRRLGDRTQELWDALIVTPKDNRLEFIRFGAGEDRTI